MRWKGTEKKKKEEEERKERKKRVRFVQVSNE